MKADVGQISDVVSAQTCLASLRKVMRMLEEEDNATAVQS